MTDVWYDLYMTYFIPIPCHLKWFINANIIFF